MPPPDPGTVDDGGLVGAFARRGTESAFRELYRRHTPRLYQLALRLSAWDASVAEDVVQETWIRAVAKLDGFRWNSSLATWLAAIAVNVNREHRRRQLSRPRLVAVDDPGDPWDATYDPGNSDKIDLERALAALPERYRQVIVLHDIEGFTHAEISGLLDIEVGTSKSQLSRARHRVREDLASHGGKVRRIR